MKLLDKYLLKQFIKHFFTVNVALAAIYLLVDFIEKIDNFTQAGKPLGLALQFFVLNIPFVVDQLGPVLILLAGVIALGILNHSNELTALKAGGIPLKKIIRPFLIGGLLFTGLLLAAAQWILPVTVATTNSIWHEEVGGKLPLGIYRNGRYYYKGTEGFYSFKWPDAQEYTFRSFSYSRWSSNYTVQELIAAETAHWDHIRKIWVLHTGQVQKKTADGGGYSISNFPYLELTLPEEPIDFLIPEYQKAELSLTELYFAVKEQETSKQAHLAWTDFLGRVSYILLGMPLLILGLPILLIAYRKWGRDLAVAIPASCGLAFLVWGIWVVLQSLAINGHVPPLFAASVIHVLFTITGLLLLKRQDT